MKRNILLVAKRNHKLLIAVRLLSTQMEVAVSSLNPVAQTLQDEQQSHAVSPAAQCHDVQSVSSHQLFLSHKKPDRIFNLITHHHIHSSLFTHHHSPWQSPLLHIEHQALQVFPFRVIDIDRMVGRLVQLVQDAHLATGQCCGGKDGIAEMLFRDHL